uniref:NADH-ubiquinone oxidoreductase chain 5 n=1 Tax=Brachidontes exustus TaxID=40254 RepID=A0A0U1X9U4_BRAEX|nr:NADH dehydrogenase subunit 5 [Brachidontes exustus]AIM58712.1 NADH dehydrogenase subunit 5 [Brachidontes exustus]
MLALGFKNVMMKSFMSAVLLGYVLLIISTSYNNLTVLTFSLLSYNVFDITFSLMFDEVSFLFVGVVLIISGSVGVYSFWYMDNEKFLLRFLWLIFLFVGSMIMLILVPNLVCLMLGWDGLGLISFLLVCYYQNSKSFSAAMVTALTNRVGDVLILMCIGMGSFYGDWIFYGRYNYGFCVIMATLLMIAGTTKSAQVPFSAWLPAAMAAPTPVSSLVHSSTLVTAGVYLLMRGFWLLEPSSLSLTVLKIMSLVTMVMAGTVAILEVDFKKIIALSTLSQLGVMMFCLSMKIPYVCFFHLVTHATFKALLFVSAGCVIHSSSGNQDMRSLGKCWMDLPISMSFLSVASMSLAGIPFMSGFYSKDLIIELSMTNSDSFLTYIIMMVGVSLTSWYSFRLALSVVAGNNKSVMGLVWTKESSLLVISYFSLFFCAVFSGWIINSKCSLVYFPAFIDSVLFWVICFIPVYGVVVFWSSVDLFSDSPYHLQWHPKMVKFVASMWNLKVISTQFLIQPMMSYSYNVCRSLDQGWLEMVGPQGLFISLSNMSRTNQLVQSRYFLSLLGGTFFFVLFFFVGVWLML